jgi:hypothetical protein
MPDFVTAAANTSTLAAVTGTRCPVDVAAEFTTHGLLGGLARALIPIRPGRAEVQNRRPAPTVG